MRRTAWGNPPDQSAKIEWKHPYETAVATWTVKAIDKSIIPEGSIIAISTLITVGFGLWVGMGYAAFLAALPMTFIFYKQAMQKTVFVYRATSKHLEVCRWRDIPDMVFIFLRVFPFLMIGVVLMLLISNPALSIAALAGPALVGIGLASVGGDSSYQTYWQDFQHDDYLWSDVLEAMLDAEQGLIVLTLPYELPPEYAAQIENPEQFNSQDVRLYFRKDQQAEVIAMVRNRIPHIELTPGRQIYEF